jgi:O-antigen ligase
MTTGSTRDELASGSEVGHVYLRQLVRAQLLLSLTALLAFGGLLAALPVALAVLPGLQRAQLLGLPVPMVVMGPPLFVLFVALGWLYARRADALDAQFAELVDEQRP